ncbi:hypothetical protein IWW36_002689 [Coemansia brasiliensis]|uniref:Uncharacterized protein n=1 Tax=Coemansia brasiliensis TaxID=2650707 RepID=A0A9W8I965_9FUNG|nr:hypothetical protein IWW36_002689 [Coemansia brasiliensis]
MWFPVADPLTTEVSSGSRGCIAIVTGASRGLGYAITVELLRRRVSVIGVARSGDKLREMMGPVMSESRGHAQFFPCEADVATDQGIAAISACLSRSGQVLIALINNAGVIDPIAPIATASMDKWRDHFDVNLFAVVQLTQQLLPILRMTKGRVINISSGAATHPYQGWSAYCASKAAINMFTESLAIEEPEVTTMAVRPGVVDTEMQDFIREKGEDHMHKEDYEKFVKLHRDGELLAPEKPARVIARLALEAPRELSGKFFSWDSPETDRLRSQYDPMNSPNIGNLQQNPPNSGTILPPSVMFGPE